MPRPRRPLPVVLAGVLAMLGSLLALAAVVVADVSEARQTPGGPPLDDDLLAYEPVRLEKVVHREVPDFVRLVERLELERVDFGTFEGY